MPIPWFYIWSEPVFDKIMQGTLKEFDLNPIKSDISTLKDRASLIVNTLNKSSEPAIIFSVSDLIVKPEFLSEVSKIQDEMVFMEGPNGTLQTELIYLKNNTDVLEFWTSIASSDTSTLAEVLKGFKGKWSKFSKKCQTTDTWDKISEFNILVLISSGFGKEFDFAEKIFTIAQHIELQQYMQYVPEGVIPFIYKIQELMFLTHKEMKKTS
jgi:hypothetical protein